MAKDYSLNTGSIYSRFYESFGGLRGDARAPRAPYLVNMYRDYKSGGEAIESIPGFRRIAGFSGRIRAIVGHSVGGRFSLFVYADTSLYRLPREEDASPILLSDGLSGEDGVFLADGDDLYFLDGISYYRYDGAADRLVRVDGDSSYIPTVYRDGVPYEQRNLLTQCYRCEYRTPGDAAYSGESEGLLFHILDRGAKTCELSGIGSFCGNVLVIPAMVRIDGESYAVTRVGDAACLSRTELKDVVFPPMLEEIGIQAFASCTSLTALHLPDSVHTLRNGAFNACPLTKIYLGRSLSEVYGSSVSVAASPHIYYAGTAEDFSKISFYGVKKELKTYVTEHPDAFTPSYESEKEQGAIFYYPLLEPCEEILSVTIGGEAIGTDSTAPCFYTPLREGEGITRLSLSVAARGLLDGKTLSVTARAPHGKYGGTHTLPADLRTGNPVYGCRLGCEFDGRVFLSGNPAFPNGILYSARRADGKNDFTYFGAYNYLHDGTRTSPISALLSVGDALYVFKDGAADGGSIFRHQGSDTDDALVPRIYPSTEGHAGGFSVGAVCNYLDEPIFLTEDGLYAIEKSNVNLERSITSRSYAVAPRLAGAELGAMRLCEWEGYLVLLAEGGRIFLFDGRDTYLRDGHREYAAYPLEGIGVYTGQYPLYRFAARIPPWIDGVELSPNAGGEVPDSRAVRAEQREGGSVYTLRMTDASGYEHTYLCDTDGEMTGGVFAPAAAICTVGDALYFGCEDGSLCIFNSDLPRREGILPRRAYTFNGRRYLSGFAIGSDDCGIPHLTKNSVKRSAVLHAKRFTHSRIRVRVRTDREGYEDVIALSGAAFDFGAVDFSFFSFDGDSEGLFVLPEKKKRWVEKQFYFYNEDYACPFGVYSFTYRYRIAGRVKEN